jgi:hypothetical protein
LKVTDPETDSVDAASFAVTVTVPLPFPEEGEMLKPDPVTLAVHACPAETLMVWVPPSAAKERLFGLTDSVGSTGVSGLQACVRTSPKTARKDRNRFMTNALLVNSQN